ncbi:MAG: ECF transporter S component [Lachnospiraceae bacterium]|nr:ECF transporter S component [Lachnospiraceae bacterium]
MIEILMLVINLLFFLSFERTRPQPQEILPIVVISCGASLGRVIFSIIPQVQPVTVLVIVMGSVYGCRNGFVTGALCALISNLFLGQGPWTLYQMTAWGIVGFLAGLLEKVIFTRNEKIKCVIYSFYSFLAAFLFSIITDFLTISYLGESVTFASALTVFTTGIVFNIGHAVFNVILMLFLYGILSRKLIRVRNKSKKIRI